MNECYINIISFQTLFQYTPTKMAAGTLRTVKWLFVFCNALFLVSIAMLYTKQSINRHLKVMAFVVLTFKRKICSSSLYCCIQASVVHMRNQFPLMEGQMVFHRTLDFCPALLNSQLDINSLERSIIHIKKKEQQLKVVC